MRERTLQLTSEQFDQLGRAIDELDPARLRMRTARVLSAVWGHSSRMRSGARRTGRPWSIAVELDAVRDDRGNASLVIRTRRSDRAALMVAVCVVMAAAVGASLARQFGAESVLGGGWIVIAGWAAIFAGVPVLLAVVWWSRVRGIHARVRRVLDRAGLE